MCNKQFSYQKCAVDWIVNLSIIFFQQLYLFLAFQDELLLK